MRKRQRSRERDVLGDSCDRAFPPRYCGIEGGNAQRGREWSGGQAEPTGVGRCWDSVRGAITLSDVAHSCAVLHAIRVTPHTEAYGREKLTLGLRGSKRDTRLAGGHSQR